MKRKKRNIQSFCEVFIVNVPLKTNIILPGGAHYKTNVPQGVFSPCITMINKAYVFMKIMTEAIQEAPFFPSWK